MTTADIQLAHDGFIDIAIGRSRKETNWKNKETQWSELVKRVSTTHRTAETYSEYITSKKTRQDEIKDIGGFVGGYLSGGKRKAGNVLHRQLVTLDIDFCKGDFWEDFTMLYDNAAVLYSTHKHHPESPRLRLVLPLDRPVLADEYMAISRRIAGILGINNFDPTTFEPSRLMYWPSTPKDGDYVFEFQDGPWLIADEILSSYRDWRDSSEWPFSEAGDKLVKHAIKKQGDPLEKPGVVGAFCRTYSISEVIERYLEDVYEACAMEGRYTYKEGSTAAGLVVYEDKYAFSHHGTDPISGKLCNAFDLVRIHRFGLKDEDAREGTPGNKLPSFNAMVELATKDGEVRKRLASERIQNAMGDFTPVEEEGSDEVEPVEHDDEWMSGLDVDRKGNAKNTIDNIVLVLENDPYLKGKIGFNEFEQRECVLGTLPWTRKKKDGPYFTDSDVSALIHYLEKAYELSSGSKIEHALKIIFSRYSFNPLRDYLEGLEWDGENRVDTLLIDFLGAEDNEYVRAATRKTLVAAVARAFKPGTKFDYMLTFVGAQGVGKSSLIQKLAVEETWYSESFSNIHGKEAQESVQGVWLAEMAELAGLKKADVETIKHFISTRFDRFRVAYGKRSENFPRQCVFFGTTNNPEFLKDQTGNRRFWPIDITRNNPELNVHDDLSREIVDQLWAEAVVLYRAAEPLYLSRELEEMARKVQEDHSEFDERKGLILQYLDTLLPENWEELNIYDKRAYLKGSDELIGAGVIVRNKVCAAEIWCELFEGKQGEMNSYNTKFIHDALRNLPQWTASEGKIRFKNYGIQKGYVRLEKHEKSGKKTVAHDVAHDFLE